MQNLLNKAIAYELYRIGAIQDKSKSPEGKGFKLKLHEKTPKATLSPFYINLRTSDNPKPGPLTQKIVEAIGLSMFLFACRLNLSYDLIVPIPMAGNPLAKGFAKAAKLTQDKDLFVLKLEKKETSQGREIVFPNKTFRKTKLDGKVPLIIDDLITKSDSKEETIKALENRGLKPRDILVLIDREQGGAQQLNNQGYQLHSVFKFSELLGSYLWQKLMPTAIYQEIKEYLRKNS